MKKLLSVLLTVVMLVVPVAEMTAFAAPSIADSFDAADETIEFSADGEEIAPDDEIADLEAEITYTVSFDANGGENPPLFQTKTEYKNLAITASLPTREGYTFAGWALSPTATVADYVPGSVYTEDKDVTLFAVWSDKYHGYESVAASFKVCATPHYFMTGYEPTYNNGYESLMLYEIPNGNGGYTNLRNEIYLTPEQLGIEEGTADDYFLSCFDLLVVMDENNQIHSILSAKSKLVKKTVTDLEFCEVTSNKVSSYLTDTVMDVYGNNVETMTKVLSGKILAGTEEIYAYNAPFTYLEPTYYDVDGNGNIDADEKYALRNTNNVVNYNLTKHVEGDVEVFELTNDYYLVDWYNASSDDYAPDANTPDTYVAWEAQAEALIEQLPLVYYGGLYEADIYDVDGDGVYDYIDYKPYSVFQVDTDEDEDFAYSTFTATTGGLKIPYIYTEGATVTGEAFADEDVVLGYFNEDNETVHVVEVLEPIVSSVRAFNIKGTLTLGSGEVVDAASKWRMVNNYVDPADVSETGNLENATLIYDFKVQTQWEVATSAFFRETILDTGDEYEFYTHDGIVLCAAPVNDYTKFTENLIIPTTLGGTKCVRESMDYETGDVIHYVYAYVDGSVKYVPVKYDENLDTYGPVDANCNLNAAYEDKLCTYTESNGVYTIVPLSIDVYHEDDVALYDFSNPVTEAIRSEFFDLDDPDEKYQYYGEIPSDVTIEKVVGTRFAIKESGNNIFSYIDGSSRTVDLTDNTKIVIRNTDDSGKVKYLEFDKSSFVASPTISLSNVSFILENNPDSKSRENLVVLYGEAYDWPTADDGENTPVIPEAKVITLDDIKNNLIIPTPLGGTKCVRESMDYETGNVIHYVYAYVDGSAKYVPVKYDENLDTYGPVDANCNLNAAYEDKLCIYTVDSNGLYTLYPLGADVYNDYGNLISEAVNSNAADLDDPAVEYLYYLEGWNEYTLEMLEEAKFNIKDYEGNNVFGTDRSVELTADTKIIVCVEDWMTGKTEYIVNTAADITSSLPEGCYLSNISAVVSNNTASTASEKLVVLYGEATEWPFGEDDGEDTPVIPEAKVIALDDIKNNLIIPTTLGGLKDVKESMDYETGNVIHYVYAYVDGSVKYVPVKYNDSLENGVIDSWNCCLNGEYEDKLCTYTVDADGFYTIYPLGTDVYDCLGNQISNAVNSNAADLDDSAEEYLYYGEGYEDVSLTKVAGSRFNISDWYGNIFRAIDGTSRSIELTEDTKIVIREIDYYDRKITYKEFDISTFTKSLEPGCVFNNVSFVISNNPDSKSQEKLVVLYGETDDLSFKATVDDDALRIVSGYEINKDEDDKWRYYYDLYNPYTAEKETHVASVNTSTKATNLPMPFAIGDIINLEDGMVDECGVIEGVATNEANLVWIADVDASEGFIQVVPYDSTLMDVYTDYNGDGKDDGDDEIVDYVDAAGDAAMYPVHDIEGNVIRTGYYHNTNFIEIDDDTVISVVRNGCSFTSVDFWRSASMNLSSLEAIANKEKQLLCYHDKSIDKNGNYVKTYSDFVKAYVSVDMNVASDECPVAEFILIVVNNQENAAYGNPAADGEYEEETVNVTEIRLNCTELTLSKGEQKTILATIKPDDATDTTVTWSSSDTSVVTVDGEGVVTAVARGTATITATANNGSVSAECVVTVASDEFDVSHVVLGKTNLYLEKGDTETLTATVYPVTATNKDVTWKSSDTSVVKVENGVVTAMGDGNALITVTTVDGKFTASCAVTVEDKSTSSYDVCIYTDAQPTAVKGGEFTFTVSLSGTYDGYAFDIVSKDGFEITEVTSADGEDDDDADEGIHVTQKQDRWLVSVIGNLNVVQSAKTEIVKVKVKVDEDAVLCERELSLWDVCVSDVNGDGIASVKYEYATISITDQLPGDINGDNKFDYYDVSKLYAYFRGKTTLEAHIITDINGDDTFNYYDVSKLYAIYRGKANFEN